MLRGLGIIFVLLASPIPGVAELPPEVQADKYLEQAKRLMENKDYTAALDMMDAIADLKRKQEFELPTRVLLPVCADGIARGQSRDGDEIGEEVFVDIQ